MKLLRFIFLSVSLLLSTALFAETNTHFADRPDVKVFIQEMVKQYHFDPIALTNVFNQVQPDETSITHMERPFEAKPWYVYREHFMTDKRIKGGVAFWQKYQGALVKASRDTGVPPEILVAIIGVESHYGSMRGKFSAIDVLSALAFDFPRRSAFFRWELKQYLLLCREQGWDPLTIKSSYAGALGQPQFMPSSYRRFARAYDGGKKIDLFDNEYDVIESIANYFAQHGWEANMPIASVANIKGELYLKLPSEAIITDKMFKPKFTLHSFEKYGVTPVEAQYSGKFPALLLSFEMRDNKSYWLGFNNFYVITTYNTSRLYALAVYQLSQDIKLAYQAQH